MSRLRTTPKGDDRMFVVGFVPVSICAPYMLEKYCFYIFATRVSRSEHSVQWPLHMCACARARACLCLPVTIRGITSIQGFCTCAHMGALIVSQANCTRFLCRFDILRASQPARANVCTPARTHVCVCRGFLSNIHILTCTPCMQASRVCCAGCMQSSWWGL